MNFSTATIQATALFNASSMTTSLENMSSKSSVWDRKDVAVILSCIFFSTAAFGIIANSITIHVLRRPSMLKSVFNYFIISLAVSDLISALISPLFVYRRVWGTKQWQLSSFVCKAYMATDHSTSAATSLHVMIFSILRLVAMKWPFLFRSFKKISAKRAIFTLWVVAFGGNFVPIFIWTEVGKSIKYVPSCSIHNEKTKARLKLYSVIGNGLFFFLPCIVVIIISVGLIFIFVIRRKDRFQKTEKDGNQKLHEKEMKRRKKERNVILQLMLIVGSFLVGYLPLCVFYILTYGYGNGLFLRFSRTVRVWFGTASYICLRISECLNPIFYNIASSKIRSETKRCLRRMLCLKTPENNRNKISRHLKTGVIKPSGAPPLGNVHG